MVFWGRGFLLFFWRFTIIRLRRVFCFVRKRGRSRFREVRAFVEGYIVVKGVYVSG